MQHEREARSNKLTSMIGPGNCRVVTEVEKPRGSTFLLESDLGNWIYLPLSLYKLCALNILYVSLVMLSEEK